MGTIRGHKLLHGLFRKAFALVEPSFCPSHASGVLFQVSGWSDKNKDGAQGIALFLGLCRYVRSHQFGAADARRSRGQP